MILDYRRTQAEALEELNSSRPVKVIAVTGGKGGVGKTTVSANLAVSIAAQGRDVMLVDADLGLANVDVVLGLHTRFHLGHVVKGECALEDAIVTGPHGLQIVPAASGIKRMATLSQAEHAGIIRAFSDLYHRVEVLVVDTAAGLHDSVTTFSQAAHHVRRRGLRRARLHHRRLRADQGVEPRARRAALSDPGESDPPVGRGAGSFPENFPSL